MFVELQNQYGPRGVQFIGVSTDDEQTRKDVPRFVRDHRIKFPIWMDATPEHQSTFRLATLVPATMILDREGRPVFRLIGESNRQDLQRRLDWLLSDRSPAAPAELVLPAGITPEHFKEHEMGLEDKHEEEEAAGSQVPS